MAQNSLKRRKTARSHRKNRVHWVLTLRSKLDRCLTDTAHAYTCAMNANSHYLTHRYIVSWRSHTRADQSELIVADQSELIYKISLVPAEYLVYEVPNAPNFNQKCRKWPPKRRFKRFLVVNRYIKSSHVQSSLVRYMGRYHTSGVSDPAGALV